MKGELQRENVPLEDVLAEKYWNAEVPEDPETFDLDFDSQEVERRKILDEAVAAGIKPEYITGKGKGTFRGKRFKDMNVRVKVEQYEDFQELLKATRYYDSWKELPVFASSPENVRIYKDWLAFKRERQTLAFEVKYGADIVAFVKSVDKAVPALREAKRIATPALEVALVHWGYISSVKTIKTYEAYKELQRNAGLIQE